MLSNTVEDKIIMRFASERYAEEVYSAVKENYEHLSEWMPWATKDYSVNSAKEFIKLNLQRYAENELCDYFIFQDDKFVGTIGFNRPDIVNSSVEIGYWLDKNHTGRGIITKCCREIVDYAFGELELNRIVIRCATGNKKSQAIPERLGFKKEGISRQAEKLNDKFVDLIIYSMLKEDWKDI